MDGEKDEGFSKDGVGVGDGVGIEVGLWGSWRIWSRGSCFLENNDDKKEIGKEEEEASGKKKKTCQ